MKPEEKKQNSESSHKDGYGYWLIFFDIAGIIGLMILGITVIIYSYFYISRPREWASAPALLPILVGFLLVITSFFLLRSTLREKKILFPEKPPVKLTGALKKGIKKNIRGFQIILLVAVYYFILIRILPFELATALYLFSSFHQFWKEGSPVTKIIISIILPLILTYIFTNVFYIHLPGSSLMERLL